MKAIIRRFNKFSSFPLLVEAGRDLTGSVSFEELGGGDYHPGDIIDVYFEETKEGRHYFRL